MLLSTKAPAAKTFAAGLPILIALARNLEFLGRDYTSVFHPVSIHVVLSGFFGLPPAVLLLLWMAAFYSWNRSLFSGGATAPARTLWLWGFVTLISLAVYSTGWPYGMRYQGQRHMQVWLLVSLVLCATSGYLLFPTRKRPNFNQALAGHTLLWLWMMTVAVPWLGEMI